MGAPVPGAGPRAPAYWCRRRSHGATAIPKSTPLCWSRWSGAARTGTAACRSRSRNGPEARRGKHSPGRTRFEARTIVAQHEPAAYRAQMRETIARQLAQPKFEDRVSAGRCGNSTCAS